MKFCCASNTAIKKVKIAKEKFFTKSIFITHFPKKIQTFTKNKIYFWILEVLPVILSTYLPGYVNHFQHIVNARKMIKFTSILYFKTPCAKP